MQQKRDISINTAGNVNASGGAFFLRNGGTVKTTIPNLNFVACGQGGPQQQVGFVGPSPWTGTLQQILQYSADLRIGNGQQTYNGVKLLWYATTTSITGLEFGYLDFGKGWVSGADTTVTGNYTKLGDIGANSATPDQLTYDKIAFSFKPDNQLMFTFVIYNNSGANADRVGYVSTITTDSKLI